MGALFSLLLLATISNAASAQTIERIEITEFGIYTTTDTGKSAAPGTATGVVTSRTNIKLVQATNTVPARLGVHFGFRYKIVGPAPKQVRLKMVTLVPQPGIRNPQTGNTIVKDEYFVDKTVGATSYRDYSFDNSWEIVTGKWTFEIWDGDRKLASQSFNVVAP